MAVFPENMNKLNVDDAPGSLRAIEGYIGYMTERIEFAMRNMTRNVSEAGMSSVEVLLLLQEMSAKVSELSSTVNAMTGDINSIATELSGVKTNINTIQTAVASLESRVTALESGTATE